MKRLLMILSILFISIYAHAVSTGVSVFIPSEAPLNFEESVSYRINLDKLNLYSVPISLTHAQVYGLSLQGVSEATQPWFYSSSFRLQALFEAHIPVKIFHLALFAGPGITWHYLKRGISENIQSDIATANGYDSVSITSSTLSGGWGYGFLAGVGFGLKFNKFTWQLDIGYQWSQSSISYNADYQYVNGGTPGTASIDHTDVSLLMKGMLIKFTVDVPLI